MADGPFDVIIEGVDPATGAVTRTPARSSDPATQEAQRRGDNVIPMTAELGTSLAAQQERARIVEGEEARPALDQALVSGARFANTLAFGLPALSDDALATDLRNDELANPGRALAVDAGAWILPALLAGAPGAAGRLAVGTAGGAAARMGMAAEGALGRVLGGSAAGRAAAIAGGAAVDGAVSGAIDTIIRSGIEGRPIEAEEILANAGIGLGVGGALGGVFGAAAGIRAARQAGRAAEVLPEGGLVANVGRGVEEPYLPNPRVFSDDADLVFQRTAPEEIEAPFLEAGAAVIGADRRLVRIANAAGPNAQDASFARGVMSRAASETQYAWNAVERVVETAADQRTRLDAAMRHGLADVDTAALRQSAEGAIQGVLAGTPGEGVAAAMGRVREALGVRGGDALAVEPVSVVQALDQHDRALAAMSDNDALRRALRSDSGQNVVMARNQLLANMRAMGPGGEALADWHAANLGRYTRGNDVEAFAQLQVAGNGSARWRLDAGRLPAAFGGGVGELMTKDTLEELVGATQEVSDRLSAAERLLGADFSSQRDLLARSQAGLRLADQWSQAREAVLRLQLAESQASGIFAGLGVGGMTIGGLVGSAIGGPVGAVAGGALGAGFAAMTHPAQAMALLQRMGVAARGTRTQVAEGVGKLRGSLTRGTRSSSTGRALAKTSVALRPPEKREEEYRAIRERVDSLATNPEALVAHLGDTAGLIGNDVSPVIGDAMAQTQMRAIQYMASAAPMTDSGGSPFGLFEDELPSLAEIDVYLQKWEAINNPVGILDLAARGALTPDHVEAVATTYPLLYQTLQAEVTQMVAELDNVPSYQQRIDVGTLLNVPIDRTLEPSFIRLMQETFAQTAQQEGAQRSSSARRSVSVRLADDTYSATQRVQQSLG